VIYMTMAVLFIAQALDVELTLGQQLMMLFVMLFTSKGAAGIAGAGFVALAATLPTLGILPAAGLTLLLGVERFMSEIRASPICSATSSRRSSCRVGWAS